MSQRVSGYLRKERDAYQTPPWVTKALIPHLPVKPGIEVYEPAAGTGLMVRALCDAGFAVAADDISEGRDFLCCRPKVPFRAIITNPPYALASEFIKHALLLTETAGVVAMLLRTDFDHAKSRRELFAECKQFAKKVVLTKRIQWFEDSTGSPSFNHAWFIWNWRHSGPPTLGYGP